MKKSIKTREKERNHDEFPSATPEFQENTVPSGTEKIISEIYGLLEEIKRHKTTLKQKGIL